MYQIELIPASRIFDIIPFLRLLNDKIEEATLRQRLEEMLKQGYECVGVYEDRKSVV